MLSHPLVVEAAETLFVPVAARNNTEDDADALLRERFGETAWNNPVVRFLGADGKDIAPKLHDDWTVAALVGGMTKSLAARGTKVPAWLDLMASGEVATRRGLERAVFAQT